jgi:hypothetical protein
MVRIGQQKYDQKNSNGLRQQKQEYTRTLSNIQSGTHRCPCTSPMVTASTKKRKPLAMNTKKLAQKKKAQASTPETGAPWKKQLPLISCPEIC